MDASVEITWELKPQNIRRDFEFLYHRLARQTDLLDINKVTFALYNISTDFDVLKILLYPAVFTDGIVTSESLAWELMKSLHLNASNFLNETALFEKVSSELVLRKHNEDAVGLNLQTGNTYTLFNGNERVATLGVSMLYVYKSIDGTYRFTANFRSNTEVALQGGTVHTLPAGMFQTDMPNEKFKARKTREEYLVEKRIMCEWLEEIFNCTAYKEEKTTNSYEDEIKKDTTTPMPELTQLMAEGKAKLYCSGVAIDLINLRPEICTVLIITEYNEKIVETMYASYESQGKGRKAISDWAVVDLINKEPTLMDYFAPQNTVASGMAAIWKGLEIVRRELKL